jgi:hypothetical protein
MREVLIVERNAQIAHLSHAGGGYVPLHPGATAYRNADFVSGSPGDMLAWCRANVCDVTLLAGDDPSTRRHRVRFPNGELYDSFRRKFR